MKTVHVLSTAGWHTATGANAYSMDTPELLTMILSVLEWGKWGKASLLTDAIGKAFVERNRFNTLYDRIGLLPALPRINHQIFWDVYKTVALETTEGRAVISDTDLVLFKKTFLFGTDGRMYFGHPEPVEMEPYPTNREHFERFGFSYGWDWSVPAVNTCCLWMPFPELRAAYTGFSLGFAENFTADTQQAALCADPLQVGWQFEPALFASQRLLGMTLARLAPTAERSYLFMLGQLPHHNPTRCGFHLWGRKEVYRTCIEPRIQFLNWVEEKILKHGAEARRLLESIQLYHTFTTLTECIEMQLNGRVRVNHDDRDTLLTRTVLSSPAGHWQAMDPCSGLTRTLRNQEPDKIYRGDILFSTEPGECSAWWNEQKIAELAGPHEPGKADWLWNVPVNTGFKVEVTA